MSFFKKINVTIARTNVVLYRVKLKKKKSIGFGVGFVKNSIGLLIE